jgi:hypothetical protein
MFLKKKCICGKLSKSRDLGKITLSSAAQRLPGLRGAVAICTLVRSATSRPQEAMELESRFRHQLQGTEVLRKTTR